MTSSSISEATSKQLSIKKERLSCEKESHPRKVPLSYSVYFITEGEVSLYQSTLSKNYTIKLDNKSSFGEIEYFNEEKKRILSAKAKSDKVVCYTLAYEMCAKLFPKMIEKEVEELKMKAKRVFERHMKDLKNQAEQADKKISLAMDSEKLNSNDVSAEVGSRKGFDKSQDKTPIKMSSNNLAPDSDAKLLDPSMRGSKRSVKK